MKKMIPALLLSASLLCLFALWNTPITGKVKNTKGAPLSGVEIKFSNKDTTFVAYTDNKGMFKTDLPEGTFNLAIQHSGYAPKNIPNIKVGKRALSRDIVLAPLTEVPEVLKMEEITGDVDVASPSNDEVVGDYNAPSPAPTAAPAPPPPPAAKTMGFGISKTAADKKSRDIPRPNYQRPAVYQYDDARAAAPEPAYNYTWDSKVKPGRDSIIPESNVEQYNKITENRFQSAKENAYSTFSIDVDAAAYSNIRRFINYGQSVPTDAVRIEEMINYFDYDYPQPQGNDPINIVTELGKCPWNPEHHLLMVGLQGREMPKTQIPPGNFVFLVDVSGSMSSEDKLPLLQSSLNLLLDELRPNDRVALVTYAGATQVVLPSTPASEKQKIMEAIALLTSGGSTAGASGIQLAYQTARTHFNAQGNNRVILCTDGDFNVGISSQEELVKLIEKERESGVYLTVLGFGTGNYQDGKMQELADRGNGNHAYIDQIGEAQKVLVKEFGGTLYTIAKDVKLQLIFNPDQVESYRLIGYENRVLAKEDFDNDKKDAGELGAGHTVTALYEIVPNKKGSTSGDLVTLKFRYKPPTGNQSSLLVEQTVKAACAIVPSNNFQFAAAVAESGLLLRNSTYKGSANWKHVQQQAKAGLGTDTNGYRKEFIDLMGKVR